LLRGGLEQRGVLRLGSGQAGGGAGAAAAPASGGAGAAAAPASGGAGGRDRVVPEAALHLCVRRCKPARKPDLQWTPPALLPESGPMANRRTYRPALPPRSPLTPVELKARRAAVRRRRVRRRRTLAGVVLATVALVIAVFALAGSGSGSDHAATASAASSGSGHSSTTSRAPATGRHGGKSRSSARHRTTRKAAAGATLTTAAAARARAVDHVLGYTSYVQLAGHRRREVALTFDDGPSPYTTGILKVLKRFDVPATFFVVGRSIDAFPSQLGAELAAGHAIGDHTQSHAMLGALSGAAQSSEIVGLAHLLARHHVPYPVLMRPPYGSFDAATLQIVRAQRMLMVLWSVDTSDYARPGVNRIVYTAVSGAQPGAIILMHDGGGDRSQTIAALPRIIRALQKKHYRLVTVPRLVRDDPPPRHQPAPHPLSGGI
jgi:peptidoglycan-N-acetylglucosamine deacetylase